MKAVIKGSQNRGIEVVDEPYPELKPGFVIVKIKAAGICGTDLHTYENTNHPQSQTARLKPLGHEGSGTISEVGKGVEGFNVGDRVTFNPFAARENAEAFQKENGGTIAHYDSIDISTIKPMMGGMGMHKKMHGM